MILDIVHRKDERILEISYIKENGQKDIIKFNANRMKTYKYDANGAFKNWNGARCSEAWTSNPSKFDIKMFISELEPKYRNILLGKTFPKMYAWDIETDTPEDVEPDGNQPHFPITTISICNTDLDTIVLGWKPLSEIEQKWVADEYDKYIDNVPFIKTLGLKKKPRIQYMKFDNEEKMLRYFLEVIVANVPVFAGWNCMNYDWTYIVNRIKIYFPFLSISMSSKTNHTHTERFNDRFTDLSYNLPMPDHTWIVDMMDVIATDYVVMPEKEALNIDYIAHETMGINKLEYAEYGSLENLLRKDYPRYVLYNGVDSLLVQLIDKYFKTMLTLYMLGQYCEMKLSATTSKIAMTEAVVFRDFNNHNLKVVWEERNPVRGRLLGAYVKNPVKGLHRFCCCNDFASLYPSTIVTCNLSFENFIGHFWDEAELAKYSSDKNYILFGPNVYKNLKPDAKQPEIGPKIGTFLNEKALKDYRAHPDKYFVTVNGSVYDNTKDSSFRRIQGVLKKDRNVSKYLSKDLDAHVMSDLEHLMQGRTIERRDYKDNEIQALAEIGFENIKSSDDLVTYKERWDELKTKLSFEIVFHTAKEQSMKILGNSMYGGSSHISFYWYNMDLANDITGEARNLTLMMEKHLSSFWKENWVNMTDWHKKWGIEVDPEKAKKLLGCNETVIGSKTGVHEKGDLLVYGDSVTGDSLIHTSNGEYNGYYTIEQLYDMLNDYEEWHNKDSKLGNGIMTPCVDRQGNLINLPIKRVIRHKTSKGKWHIKTHSGKEIICTSDHSIIVMRDGKRIEVKPEDIRCTDDIICTDYFTRMLSLTKPALVDFIGDFDDEYVYDIEVDTEDEYCHNFFANDILVHNTDSLYSSYDPLLQTIKGYENMSDKELLDIVLKINLEFLDNHNNEYITEYYNKRGGKSIHAFELETVSLAGIWLDKKKNYAQILLWKDGKFFDMDNLKLKAKGLEVIKGAWPKYAKKLLHDYIMYLFTLKNDGYIAQKINIMVQETKQSFMDAPIDSICGSVKVNKYGSNVGHITGKGNKATFERANAQESVLDLQCKSQAGRGVKGAYNYNRIKAKYNIPGDTIRNGKVKWYFYRNGIQPNKSRSNITDCYDVMCFEALNYPEWLEKYAPIDRRRMFQTQVIDPMNRIMHAIGEPLLTIDGQLIKDDTLDGLEFPE